MKPNIKLPVEILRGEHFLMKPDGSLVPTGRVTYEVQRGEMPFNHELLGVFELETEAEACAAAAGDTNPLRNYEKGRAS
jgi:hypothetical protein